MPVKEAGIQGYKMQLSVPPPLVVERRMRERFRTSLLTAYSLLPFACAKRLIQHPNNQ